MNEKNKIRLGLIICLGVSLYLIVTGMGEKYYIVMWTLGGGVGLAISKLRK